MRMHELGEASDPYPTKHAFDYQRYGARDWPGEQGAMEPGTGDAIAPSDLYDRPPRRDRTWAKKSETGGNGDLGSSPNSSRCCQGRRSSFARHGRTAAGREGDRDGRYRARAFH